MSITFLKDKHKFKNEILTEIEADDAINESDLDPEDWRKLRLDQLPREATQIASYKNDMDHSPGLTWHSELVLYLTPIKSQAGGYAIIALDWDDNWEQWEWRIEAAVMDAGSAEDAKRAMLWQYVNENFAECSESLGKFLRGLYQVTENDDLEWISWESRPAIAVNREVYLWWPDSKRWVKGSYAETFERSPRLSQSQWFNLFKDEEPDFTKLPFRIV